MVQWLQKIVARPGQRHAFAEGAMKAACRVVSRESGQWQEAPSAMRCAICARKVDPNNAPKAPKGRWE